MGLELSKINKAYKKVYLGMDCLFLELSILMMEPFIKDLYKMDKNQVKENSKDPMDFNIPVILNMINSMGMDKFIILINQLIQDILKTDFKMEKVVW